ncbi:hypothetical protein MMC34_008368, partial [Xylographa carneopallida]|nr:hypothetical protein [Xylographa carneopallida]
MEETHSFRDMAEISPETLSVLDTLGFKQATPVQEATIPLFCGHKDVAVDACTGSGKTLAFVLPIIEKLRKLDEPLKKHQASHILIRQSLGLPLPVAEACNLPGFKPCCAGPRDPTGILGACRDPQADVAAFQEQGGNILVGTPGRLSDIFERSKVLDARKLEVLVLDEADRLLDAGYGKHLENLMRRLPKQRRT